MNLGLRNCNRENKSAWPTWSTNYQLVSELVRSIHSWPSHHQSRVLDTPYRMHLYVIANWGASVSSLALGHPWIITLSHFSSLHRWGWNLGLWSLLLSYSLPGSFFYYYFAEIDFYYVSQAGLELTMYLRLASAGNNLPVAIYPLVLGLQPCTTTSGFMLWLGKNNQLSCIPQLHKAVLEQNDLNL